jgi:hypothetical protein
MIEHMILGLLLGVPASYLLDVMLLQKRSDHEGPFKSWTKRVYFSDTKHDQAVALWDWIRRLARVYDIEGNIWTVNANRAERFTCPFCLSFWTSFVLSVPVWIMLNGSVISAEWVYWLVVFHFTIAVSSFTIERFILD